MCVKGQRSWIFRSYNGTRQNKDKERKGLRNSRLTDAKECERCTKVLRIGKLLQMFAKNFARVVKLLYKITRKDVKWNWNERQ